MSRQHAKTDPIAEAAVLQLHAEEESDVREPVLLELFLDADGYYRWYEEEDDSEIFGASVHEAIANAENAWRGFQLVEVRGQQVEIETEIPNAFATDEIEEAQQRSES